MKVFTVSDPLKIRKEKRIYFTGEKHILAFTSPGKTLGRRFYLIPTISFDRFDSAALPKCWNMTFTWLFWNIFSVHFEEHSLVPQI